MKKIHALVLTITAVLPFTGIVSCGPSKGTTRVSVPQADNSNSAALFNDVNRYRASLGKPPLKRHPGLDAMAREHSEYMRRNRSGSKLTSHAGFSSRAATARQRFGLSTFHENVGAGPRGTSITRVWAASRAHEPAMRGSWSYTGVGVVVDSDGTIFATQLFGY